MQRLALLILLLTVVYSWEELKYTIVAIWSKIWKQKITYPPRLDGRVETGQKDFESDSLVSDLVLIASIPLTLTYLIMGEQNLTIKLLFILAEFVLLGLIIRGIEEYKWRRRFTSHYEGMDKISGLIFSLVGLVSPSVRYAGGMIHTSARTGKYLLTLAVPLVSGIALTVAVQKLGLDEFNKNLDILIAIAVLGLVLNVTIEILEHMFRTYRWHLGSLMRVVLGVLILFTITNF